MSNQEKIQEIQKQALDNIVKYVCRVAGSDFISIGDRTIKEELAILTSQVENIINDK